MNQVLHNEIGNLKLLIPSDPTKKSKMRSINDLQSNDTKRRRSNEWNNAVTVLANERFNSEPEDLWNAFFTSSDRHKTQFKDWAKSIGDGSIMASLLTEDRSTRSRPYTEEETRNIVKIKNSLFISDESYQRLRTDGKIRDLPPLNHIKGAQKTIDIEVLELVKMLTVDTVDRNGNPIIGIEVKPEDALMMMMNLALFRREGKGALKAIPKKIRIKLSMDARVTTVGGTSQVLIAISSPDLDNPDSPYSVIPLLLVEASESLELLEAVCQDMKRRLANIQKFGFRFNGKQHDVEVSLCTDMLTSWKMTGDQIK